MLARTRTSYCPVFVSVCECLSDTSRYSVNGLIWFLASGLLSTSPTLCFKEIQVSKNNGTFHWNFFLNSGLSPRHIDRRTCYQLSSRKVHAQNWTVVGQLSWNTWEIRRSATVVYRRYRQALSTARFCRAGQSTTGYICLCYILLQKLPQAHTCWLQNVRRAVWNVWSTALPSATRESAEIARGTTVTPWPAKVAFLTYHPASFTWTKLNWTRSKSNQLYFS